MSGFGDIFGKPTPPPGPPKVTFICAGNICRSPLAEKVFRHVIDRMPSEGIVTASAGHQAVVGAPMDPQPASIATREGADPTHVATQVTDELLRSSTLVLTMTRDQRALIAREYPFALKRTFTLTEFVRILDELPAQVPGPSLREGRLLWDTVDDAARFRGMISLSDNDDIEDPYRRSSEVHERVGSRIAELVNRLAVQVSGNVSAS